MSTFFDRVIRWGFYAIFLFVPLILFPDTSELFEFNKIWFLFAVTLIIGGAWISKMIIQKRIHIQKTPLDIFILIFLLSQIISTIFSLDQHISWWGYYTRFNGGLLSTITYIFLYYALLSNLPQDKKPYILRLLKVSLFSGLAVALWGLPSHFGYDPTCLIFRGQFDVSCWTDAFQPKVRMFSTMGQPDWLAAYLSVVIPIALGFALIHHNLKNIKDKLFFVGYLLLAGLFYLDFLYTHSKGSFIAQLVAFAFFFAALFYLKIKEVPKKLISIGLLLMLIITFFIGNPVNQLYLFSFEGLQQKISSLAPKVSAPSAVPSTAKASAPAPKANPITGEMGGSDSGKIRSFVWHGAIDIWLHNPLFGTGVETFAFAYYKYRPAGHNLTSEWDYLYNKAHNEYLNYLATTGALGLGSYLVMIAISLWLMSKNLILRRELDDYKTTLIQIALISAYISILISDFFGFSVVIINVYLFLIPAFALVLLEKINPEHAIILPKNATGKNDGPAGNAQKMFLIIAWIIVIYLILVLYNFWQADREYGLGLNLDHVNMYTQASTHLRNAVDARPGEPVFKDELSINDAILAAAYAQQKDQQYQDTAKHYADEAIQLSNELTTNYPNNLLFWKTRVRIFYTLTQAGGNFLTEALDAIKKASDLAPTDAKIWYNLGLLYAQNDQLAQGELVLRKVTEMKPDYRDAFYGLGLVLHQEALDKNGKVVNLEKEQEAVSTLKHILSLYPDDKSTQDTLKSWGEKL